MRRGNLWPKIAVILGAVVVGVLGVLYVNGYFAAWSAITRVDKVAMAIDVNSDGTAHVVQKNYYTFVKDYHGIATHIQFPGDITMRNFRFAVDGATVQRTTGPVDSHGFDLRIYLNDGYNVPKPGGDNVELTTSYDVTGGFQNGTDFSQFFQKFWGPDTASFVPEMVATYTFAPNLDVKDVYVHPIDLSHTVVRKGNVFTITYRNVPPNTYAEARFVFPKTEVAHFSGLDKSLSEITGIEKSYENGVTGRWIVMIVFVVLIPLIPLLFFYLFGVEPKVSLLSEYERDIPYRDPPDLVNAIVKRLVDDPDSDGFAAMVLDLVDKGYLEFAGNSAFRLTNRGKKPLSDSERLFFEMIIKKFAVENIFDPDALKASMKGNIEFSKRFLVAYDAWKTQVRDAAELRNYLLTYGNVLTKAVTVIGLMILPISVLMWEFAVSGRPYPHLFFYFSLVVLADWAASWIILVLPRDVFGRWTKTGREYYLRWSNFAKYLGDYSLIKEKPPESVVVWNQFLVYGTAIGMAKEVIKAIKTVKPPDFNESNPMFPAWSGIFWYESMASLRYQAIANSVQSSNVGGGGGGSFGGGVGGGFGGGGSGGF